MNRIPERFDVYLSYNRLEKVAVRAIAQKLSANNITFWRDYDQLVPGELWQPGLATGILTSLTFAMFVGPNSLGDWHSEEMNLAQNRAAKDSNFRAMLVLLPGLSDRFDYERLPPFMAMRTWIDFRKGLEDAHAFHRLVCGIRGISPGAIDPTLPTDFFEPYRGLAVFDEEHAPLFFGRELDVQRLIEKIRVENFLAVLGPSGSGKSSLVRAGLIPALRQAALPLSDNWVIRIHRPSARPLAALAKALHDTTQVPVTAYTDILLKTDHALYDEGLLLLNGDDQKLVWVIDQFEEIFTLCADESERRQFISNLLYPTTVRKGRMVIIITMRADFYFKCAAYPDLAIRMTANQYLVSPMTADALKVAIEQPANLAGYAFEPGLSQAILNEVAAQPSSLPLLQHALMELWARRNRVKHEMTFAEYHHIGGVAGALAKRAEDEYQKLKPAQQKIAKRVLLRLTQPGDGTEDTRRTASFGEFVTHPEEKEEVEETIGRLVDARLLTISGSKSAIDFHG